MALIPVINNHTGDEGEVDETWLERWPEDFAPVDPEVAAHIAELLAAGAAQEPTEDPESEPPTSEEPPSDGTTEEIN